VRIKKSHLKELIRNSIIEKLSEDSDDKYVHIGYGKYKEKGKEDDKSSPTFEKDDSGKFVPLGGDVGGPAHPNVPKKKTKSKSKSKMDIETDPFEKNKKSSLAHFRIGGKGYSKLKESKGRRTTVKEIKKWMKGLEENRYKKTYASDARRVSWFVNNNLSEDYDTMPISMRKKWDKAQYGRERFLAKEFIKHLESKQMNENKLEEKLRGIIREVIKKELNEAYRSKSLFFDKKYKSKLEKLLKKHKGKFPFNPSGEPVVNWSLNDRGSKGIEWGGIPKSNYNKAIEFFMQHKLNPRG